MEIYIQELSRKKVEIKGIYIQELSRKEVEIKEMRALQFQTETTLRELQLTMSTKEEKYQVK